MLIAIVNKSKKITNAEVLLMTKACASQMRRHAAPAWDARVAPVIFYEDEAQVPDDACPIYFFDVADEADALGYHFEDPEGREYGKVFVDVILDNGGTKFDGAHSLSCVLSHEILELWGDPNCNKWGDAPDGKSHAWELCDAVEGDAYPIKVGKKSVSVSNFLFPEWFDSNDPGADSLRRFDQMGVLKKPFTIAKGGYTIFRTAGKEHSLFGAKFPKFKRALKAHVAARTNRRQKKRA
jgi:hypothetical protein